MLNAFTVDVEDYFQVTAFERQISRADWHQFSSRVVQNTRRLLSLLERKNVFGTFFVLGWTADRFPWLVEEIAAAGHEIGSHSYWHRLIHELSPGEFEHDLRRSIDVLESVICQPVTAYRAPSFSVRRSSLWALNAMARHGIELDSSVFPGRHDRYGIPGAPMSLHAIDTPDGVIWEFPPTVYPFGWSRISVAGGGYFRIWPYPFLRGRLREINERFQRPIMFYIHPWEIDPEQPKLPVGTRAGRWRHRVNLHQTEERLERLLDDFLFGRVCDVMAEQIGDHTAIVTTMPAAMPTL